MNIKEAYEKSEIFAEGIVTRNGFTLAQSEDVDRWPIRFLGLAAFLGWDHRIITDEDSEEYSSVMDKLEEVTPSRYVFNHMSAAYGLIGIVSETGRIPFNQ